MAEPPTKRRRLGSNGSDDDAPGAESTGRATPSSLSHAISPPRLKRARVRSRITSPFRLTSIRDLSDDDNNGAVSLNDLIGDPLISELWDFNYLHDIDFLMNHLDEDTRGLTKVHVIHGFWKREDQNKLVLQEQAKQYGNVTLHTAYMPEMFGTHHSKMLILFRHDDTAQVVIHTANMIAKDWTNMTNGVWISPLLPKLQSLPEVPETHRFIVEDLAKYDFSAIRGALVASVSGKHDVEQEPDTTHWGWRGLKETLKSVPTQAGSSDIVRMKYVGH
ncbi:hypothetical protein O1611_g10521 [Lasiodiplodia mahajangana]|uniref:Uncharacterized protein n=1 Tax=Lasiodiplodia mahajangana TaxID=1108764 RepID=A0ACC2IXG6_9PEZI|nr:hypothetical protein O1611_g10521 [Lasiodiplodia mahajangana]